MAKYFPASSGNRFAFACIDPSTLPTLKAERKREGDTLRWKITVAINGRPVAEEALKNTIAASERFDEIVAQVKARLSPR